MNNSYKIIEENNGISRINVVDENNHSTIREIDSNNIYYTLLSENKMEMIGLKKDEINSEINASLSRLDMLKYSVPIYPLVIGVVGGFLILVKIFRPDALQDNSWYGLAAGVAAGEISVGSVAIVEHIYNKKEIKLLKEQLKALKKYENEPLTLDIKDYLDYSLESHNNGIEKEIDDILDSCKLTKKKKK